MKRVQVMQEGTGPALLGAVMDTDSSERKRQRERQRETEMGKRLLVRCFFCPGRFLKVRDAACCAFALDDDGDDGDDDDRDAATYDAMCSTSQGETAGISPSPCYYYRNYCLKDPWRVWHLTSSLLLPGFASSSSTPTYV